MDAEIFEVFSNLAYQQAGIVLKRGKESLMSMRVSKRMRALGIDKVENYLTYLQNDKSGEEIIQFINVISTNFTSFFREKDHFDELDKFMTQLLQSGQRRIRIWCAAAATGEEPYTLAMVMTECLERNNSQADVKILATDISTRALNVAQQGRYPLKTVQTIDMMRRNRYFTALPDQNYQAIPELKDMLVFRRLNLAKPPYPMKGPFDAVFCRNVMIYFDDPVRQGFVNEAERLLNPGGMLVVGHSESLHGIQTNCRKHMASVYIK